MSRGSDEELEDQARRAQEATPGGIDQSGAPWRQRVRTQYREFTAPVRNGVRQAREWLDALPRQAKWAALAALIAGATVVPFIFNATLGDLSGYWMDIVTK